MIANEFGEAADDPLHRAALIAAGLVLFVLTLLVNAMARATRERAERGSGGATPAAAMAADERRIADRSRRQRAAAGAPTRSCAACVRRGTVVALVPLVLVIYYLLKRGLGALSWDFFTTDPTGSFLGDPGGIKSAILGTIVIVALATRDRGADRRRRRAVPRRVRPRRALRATSSATSST